MEKLFCIALPPLVLFEDDFADELSDPDELDLEINVFVDDEPPDLLLEEDVSDMVVDERALVFANDAVVSPIFVSSGSLPGACGFFDAGPLLTPGFNPVCVFGEFEPLLEPDVDE